MAPQVANSGTINAKLGHVVLAGAKTATLDLYGDGLLSLDVTNQVTQVPVGADGKKVTALVTNTGVIVADGGTVQLTARAADGIVQNLVQAGGKIRAATAGRPDRHDRAERRRRLDRGGGAAVRAGPGAGDARRRYRGRCRRRVTGRLDGADQRVGQAGGGDGGGRHDAGARARAARGVAPRVAAKNVTVQQGAGSRRTPPATAMAARVTVLSDQAKGTTQMDGAISAKGGPQGGDGGFVETSGPCSASASGARSMSVRGPWVSWGPGCSIRSISLSPPQTRTRRTIAGARSPPAAIRRPLRPPLWRVRSAWEYVIVSTSGSGSDTPGRSRSPVRSPGQAAEH